MNIFYRAGARTFQGIMKLAMNFLNWGNPKILKGDNSVSKIADMLKTDGIDNVLVVTDSVLMSLGLLDSMLTQLTAEGVKFAVYDKTVPNPTIDNIEEALVMYKQQGAKGIIAFGGGSAMDCAKGVGARVARPNKVVSKMKGMLKVRKKLPPLVAIPTTAGTGSEATLAAVITDSRTHEKYPINDNVLIPTYIVLDPMLTIKLPKHITSTTGMDALTHAVEAYIGHSNTKRTQQEAVEATKLIFDNIKTAYDKPDDIAARTNMLQAAYLAGRAFTRAYVGYVHAVAHTLGGMYGAPHGLANAVILPYVLRKYGASASKRLGKLAILTGVADVTDDDATASQKFIDKVEQYNKYMSIPTKIKGIKDEDITTMVERAYREANPLYPVPQIWERQQFRQIFEEIKE